VAKLVEATKKHVEDALARARELQQHGKTAADKAYAWAKTESEQAVARANEVFEQCKKAVEEAEASLAELVKRFGREKGEKAEKKGEGGHAREEEEGEANPPQPVPGIGEEAFWLGSPKAGALYVLKGDQMVRVSVGGPDDMKTKIEKSKKLAAKALKRLG